jgi:hypothetical protein
LPDVNPLRNITICSITNNSRLCHSPNSFKADNDVCSYSSTPYCPMSDCQVLNHWIHVDSTQCCSDFRVNCDESGKVTELKLRQSNISGVIPLNIFSLDQIAKMYLLL